MSPSRAAWRAWPPPLAAHGLLWCEEDSPMDVFPIFLFILVVFANRYIFGFYLKMMRGRRFDVSRADYEPTVTVVVPLFNEGKSIYDTILSLLELDYPAEKLSITVVDDCSTDDSYDSACVAAAQP